MCCFAQPIANYYKYGRSFASDVLLSELHELCWLHTA
jgi:hypothetical protein